MFISIGIVIGVLFMVILRRVVNRANKTVWLKSVANEDLVQIYTEIEDEIKIRGLWQNG